MSQFIPKNNKSSSAGQSAIDYSYPVCYSVYMMRNQKVLKLKKES